MLGLGATAAIVAIVALLVVSALVGLLSIGLPDPTRLDRPTAAHLTLVSDRTGVILPPASLGR